MFKPLFNAKLWIREKVCLPLMCSSYVDSVVGGVLFRRVGRTEVLRFQSPGFCSVDSAVNRMTRSNLGQVTYLLWALVPSSQNWVMIMFLPHLIAERPNKV